MENINIYLFKLTHFNNTREIHLNEIVNVIPKNGMVNPDIVYKSLLLSTSTSDTSKVNINKYGKLNFKLSPIGSVFCDNIVLISLTPIEGVKIKKNLKIDNGNKFMDNQRKEIIIFLERAGHKIIPGKVKPLRVTPMDGKNNHFKQPNLEETLLIYKKYNVEYDKDKSQIVAQYFKLELAQLDYKEVLKLFNKSNISELYKSCYVKVADIDMTRDYKGTMCKRLLWQYLLKQGFREQKDSDKNEELAQEQKEEDEDFIVNNTDNRNNFILMDNNNKILLKNSSSVGSNCISYLKNDKRCKLYNKYVHSLEIKSNTQQTGTNIFNWCNNPEDRLNKTIDQCILNGFTRLEITYYRDKYDGGIPTEAEILHELDELINLIPENVIYDTPIKDQWKAFSEEIKDNVLLVDLTNNNAVLAYSINKQTNRVNGIKHTTQELDKAKNKKLGLPKENKELDLTDVLYLLTHCTYNTPIIIMFVDFFNKTTTKITNKLIDGVMHQIETKIINPYINLSYKTVMVNPKVGDKLTYMFSPSSIYYSKENLLRLNEKINNPEDRGLTDKDNVKLRIKDINDKRFYKSKKYKFGDYYFTINVETEKDYIFKKPITQKQLLINEAEESFNLDNVDTITIIKNYNSDKLTELIKQQQLKEAEQNLYNALLETVNNNQPKNLNTLTIGQGLRIKAIKENAYGYGKYEQKGYILITTKNKCFKAPPHIINFIKACIDNKSITQGKYGFIKVHNNEAIFSFTILDIFTNNSFLCVTTSKLCINPELQIYNKLEQEETNKLNTLNDVLLNNLLITDIIKVKNCINIDLLKEKEIITVTAIKLRGIGKKEKYIIYTAEYPDIPYISNPHLELKLSLYDITKIKTKFKILIGCYKTTRTKNKSRNVTIEDIDILTHTIKEDVLTATQPEPQPEPDIKLDIIQDIKPDIIQDIKLDIIQDIIQDVKPDIKPKIKKIKIPINLVLTANIKEKYTTKLESLPNENIILNVTEIIRKMSGSKIKYLFKTVEHPNKIFISNMFLEDLIISIGLNNLDKINKIKVGVLKTTRSKIKQRIITLEE